jgi:hypothetical protein
MIEINGLFSDRTFIKPIVFGNKEEPNHLYIFGGMQNRGESRKSRQKPKYDEKEKVHKFPLNILEF